MKQASVPATRALIPNPATSLLRTGATPARPPIRIAMLPRSENPHRAYVLMMVARRLAEPGTATEVACTRKAPGAGY